MTRTQYRNLCQTRVQTARTTAAHAAWVDVAALLGTELTLVEVRHELASMAVHAQDKIQKHLYNTAALEITASCVEHDTIPAPPPTEQEHAPPTLRDSGAPWDQ